MTAIENCSPCCLRPGADIGIKAALLLFCLLLLLSLGSRPLWAQQSGASLPPIEDRESIELPRDLSQLHFYLITVDVGDNVWDNFGHTALRVVDEASDTDLIFNWGLFDPGIGYLRFGSRFLRGIMDYRLGVYPTDRELARYRDQQRTVWQDRINLSNEQKRRLYQRLAWNLRDENIVYDYDYFFDNCTTRVRDYLDEALQGELAEESRARVSRSFRDEVRTHYASLPSVALSVDILLNERVDRRMTQWEQMFLPLQLRERLEGFQAEGGAGDSPGLLSDSQVLMEFPAPQSGPSAWLLLGGLWLPTLFLLLSMRRVPITSFSSRQGFTFRLPWLSYRLMGLLALIIALGSGILGSLMLFAWFGSSLEDLHHNLNLLLLWPTDILGVGLALYWLVIGRSRELSSGRHQLVTLYMSLHALAALVYLVLGLLNVSGQEVGMLMLSLVPLLLAMAFLVLAAGVHPARGLRFT